ncbi:acyl-CoA thioesterase, partial [Parasphingorhabdus sp.]|uniref:acyl-CoA thioesterase n=1 Tax=Parasphingorhabdus sp. TaxID=2709688 RepID=UPI003593E8D9
MNEKASRSGDEEAGFTLSITAQPSDIDELGHVNNAVWVRWIQDLATAHWQEVAPQDAIDRYIWVVTRHEIDYRGNVSAGDIVTGYTWISEPPKGARFWRNVRFTGP